MFETICNFFIKLFGGYTNNDIDEIEKEVEEKFSDRITQLQTVIEENDKTISSITEELDKANNDVKTLQESLNKAEEDKKANEETITNLNSELEEANKTIEELKTDYESKISSITIEKESLISKVEELNNKIASLEKEIADLKAEPISGTVTVEGDSSPNTISVYPTEDKAGEDSVKITIDNAKICYVNNEDLKTAGINLDGNESKE